MVTAKSTPAGGKAAALTLAGKPAAKGATPFRRVGCVHSVGSGYSSGGQPLRGGLFVAPSSQKNKGALTPAAPPLFFRVRRRYFALCRERTHREMTFNPKEI